MRKVSAGPTVCVSTSVPNGDFQRWPWTWKVWCSEPMAITSHWMVWPTIEVKTGVLPTKARPSIVWKSPIGAKTTSNSRSGRSSCLPMIESIPYIPPRDRVLHRRRVVVVGPHADRVAAGRELVGPRLAGLDVAVAARHAGHEGAVRARLVVHAVEVHRVRALVEGVEVLEVHEQAVAGPGAQQRAGDQVLVARAGGDVAHRVVPVRVVAAVDDRGEDRLRRVERHVVDRVALVGRHVPCRRRHRRDPELAGLGRSSGGGDRSRRPRHSHEGHYRGRASHWTTTEPFMNGWTRQ